MEELEFAFFLQRAVAKKSLIKTFLMMSLPVQLC